MGDDDDDYDAQEDDGEDEDEDGDGGDLKAGGQISIIGAPWLTFPGLWSPH